MSALLRKQRKNTFFAKCISKQKDNLCIRYNIFDKFNKALFETSFYIGSSASVLSGDSCGI